MYVETKEIQKNIDHRNESYVENWTNFVKMLCLKLKLKGLRARTFCIENQNFIFD